MLSRKNAEVEDNVRKSPIRSLFAHQGESDSGEEDLFEEEDLVDISDFRTISQLMSQIVKPRNGEKKKGVRSLLESFLYERVMPKISAN